MSSLNSTVLILFGFIEESSAVDKARLYKNTTLAALVLRKKLDLFDVATSAINYITFSTPIIDVCFTNRTFDQFSIYTDLFLLSLVVLLENFIYVFEMPTLTLLFAESMFILFLLTLQSFSYFSERQLITTISHP